MAERALRGTRLGATSYENDRNTDLAPRQEIAFDCPKGHHFTVPFAAEAEVPATWECRVCGTIAFTATGDQPSPKKTKPPRSHWDMLRERRSIDDLEQVLAERLALIRGGRGLDDEADAKEARAGRRRAAMPQPVTRQSASRTIFLLILLAPRWRSSNVIGTSVTVSPAAMVRRARSTWKQYPWESTSSRPMRRRVLARKAR